MIDGTGRRLRLTAGVATLLVLATGCSAAPQAAAPASSRPTVQSAMPTQSAPQESEAPEATPTPSAKPQKPEPPEVALAMASSKPVHLSIPAIGVESKLLRTGLRKDGTLDVPPGDDGTPASWYTGSPTPGSSGPAVLLGHVNSLTDASGVFYRLRELVPGDRISITRADGSIATFKVYSNKNYVKAKFPTKRVYFPVPGAELRLITCDGYVKGARRYDNNRVVFAKLIDAT